jgi:hypothetical protein
MFDLYDKNRKILRAITESVRIIFKKYYFMKREEIRNQVKIKPDVVLDGGLQGKDAVVTDKFMEKLDDANGKVYFLFQNHLDLSRLDQ